MLLLGVLQAQAAGAGPVGAGSFDLLETQVLASSASSVSFTGLSTYAADYQHLQIRVTSRDTRAIAINNAFFTFNGDSGSNYSYHGLIGDGSTAFGDYGVSTAIMIFGSTAGANAAAGIYAATVVDILDAFETTKYKTIRAFTGATSSNSTVRMWSGSWRNTDALSSILIDPAVAASYVAGSRFSLYGIKAA